MADMRRSHHQSPGITSVKRCRREWWLATVRECEDDKCPPWGQRNSNGFEPTSTDCVWLRYAQIYLVNAIKLCQYNPAGGERAGFGPSIERAKLPLWSRLADLFWLYFSIKLLVLQYLQHNYSLLVTELKLAADKEGPRGAGNNRAIDRHQLEEDVEARLAAAIARIELVGNPFYELGFGPEAIFVFVLFIVCMAKVQNPLHAGLRAKPICIGLVQMLLDPQRELAHTTWRDIELLAGQYLASEHNYRLVRRDEIWRTRGGQLGRTRSASKLGLVRLADGRDRALELMRDMVESGELVPPNRRPAWLSQVARTYLRLAVFFTSLGTALIVFMLVLLPTSGVLNFRLHTSGRDLLTHGELICYCLVGLQWVIFYLVLVIAVALDQMKFLDELRRSIASLIADVRHHLMFELRRPPSVHSDPGALNRRLLRALFHYKLFKRQLRASQPAVGFIGGHMFFLMLLLPVMGRLYASHLALELRLTHLACSLFFIVCCDLLVLPNCRLHARCLDLFRELSRLMAHIDAAHHWTDSCTTHTTRTLQVDPKRHRGQQQQQQVVACDWRHSVWLLRRELHLPEMAARSFATRALFLRLTYASWLGVHFWCGLLLAPLLMRDPAQLSSLANPLADTLGLFQ